MRGLTYLASPITARRRVVEIARMRIAAIEAARMILAGEPVFCPAAMSLGLLSPGLGTSSRLRTWRAWRRTDLAILLCCDRLAVLRLPGWRRSKGVRAEIRAARKHGIPVVYRDVERAWP